MPYRPRRKPKIKTYPPVVRVRDEAKARQGRKRFAEFKQRKRDAKKHRGDQVRFYQVPLLDSEVSALVADLSIDHRAGRQQISDGEWAKLVGLAIAAAARSAITKNNR